MFIMEVTLLILLVVLIVFWKIRHPAEDATAKDDLQHKIQMALAPGEAAGSDDGSAAEAASEASLARLHAQGVKVDRPLTGNEAEHLSGLFDSPSNRQLEILKHFKIPIAQDMTKTQANQHVKTIFSDPAKVVEWNQRAPTSRVKQGILFMGGQLNSHMTYLDAQLDLIHFGMEDPGKFLEWKHIEKLFAAVNEAEILERYGARKITWKRFFQLYDALKSTGVEVNNINADLLHWQAKRSEIEQRSRSDRLKLGGMTASTL